MTTAHDVLAAFRGGPRAYPAAYPRLLRLAAEHPDELPALASLVLEELPDGGAFFGAMLSWLSEENLAALAGHAVAMLSEPRPGAAKSVIDHTSLQLPGALTAHLPRLWDLDPFRHGVFYSATWPWRGAGIAEIRRLAATLANQSQSAFHLAAWICLLQSRRADGWELAWRHRRVAADLGEAAHTGLWYQVGADPVNGPPFRALVTAPTYHLVLPETALASRHPPYRVRQHPTWGHAAPRGAEAGTLITGGLSETACPRGHGPLRRLLLLDPPPPGCAATGRKRLDIAYCHRCADGWEPAFHAHGADGRPRPLGHRLSDLPLNPFEGEHARPAVRATAMSTPPRWQRQDWAMANGTQNLNRIGGEPTWIHDPVHPACPSCGAAMPFLAQLDWEHLADGEGITYILWCQQCAVSALLFQST